MKKIFNYLMAFATLGVAMVACQDPQEEPEKVEPNYPSIEVVEETLAPLPTGEELEFDIEAEGAWKIEALDEYDWITVTPESGEGNATLVFTVTANPSSKERSAEFEVKEEFEPSNADKLSAELNVTKAIKTYSFFVTQGKQESNLGEGTFEFIQAVVNGKLCGPDTPQVANWFNVTEAFPGITMENVEGKLQIVSLSGSGFTGLPEVMNLPELQSIQCRGAQLNCMLPQEWNTPKLTYINFSVCGLYGPIPEGFASTTPNLVQIFLDQNNLYGALPHEWAAGIKTLEVAIINNHANKNPDTQYYDSKDNSALGYLVPKQLDVRMNAFNDAGEQINAASGYGQGDYTQLKLGGVFEGNFKGYEIGWGQHRVEAAGTGEDEATWSIYRTLWDSPAGHSNMGYEGKMQAIPGIMMTWDQAAADAYTKEAAALNDSRAFPKLGQTAE